MKITCGNCGAHWQHAECDNDGWHDLTCPVCGAVVSVLLETEQRVVQSRTAPGGALQERLGELLKGNAK